MDLGGLKNYNVMAPLDASLGDKEEPAPGKSKRDDGEYQGDLEDTTTKTDGRAVPGTLGESTDK